MFLSVSSEDREWLKYETYDVKCATAPRDTATDNTKMRLLHCHLHSGSLSDLFQRTDTKLQQQTKNKLWNSSALSSKSRRLTAAKEVPELCRRAHFRTFLTSAYCTGKYLQPLLDPGDASSDADTAFLRFWNRSAVWGGEEVTRQEGHCRWCIKILTI